MNKIYSLLLLSMLVCGCTIVKKNQLKKVQIRVFPKSLSVGSRIYLTGNCSQLGDWNPAGLLLDRQIDGSWTKTLFFPAGARIEYKITRGWWQSMAVAANGNELQPISLS